MARLAIVLHDGSRGPSEARLTRMLEFFGVPVEELDVSAGEKRELGSESAIFGSVRTILSLPQLGFRPAAYYIFSDHDDLDRCAEGIRTLSGDTTLSLRVASASSVQVRVAHVHPDLTGPMTGLQLTLPVGTSDRFLNGAGLGANPKIAELISTGEGAVFVRFQLQGSPAYFSTSSEIVDIEQSIDKGFYDIKRHFCSAVPLVTFIKATFWEVVWGPQELSGCLIIDDPLLKAAYGHCDFMRLRDLMQTHGFTTNIAFIPWNWRRTSPNASKLFGDGTGNFSVSIHGCDHTAREFGTTSIEVLDSTAELALSRMRRHEARTGIHHDSVMVFPQGVFSAPCPGILNRNNYLAAVNTEVVPVDIQSARTRIRDVWDVAIMSYGDFPIFTRRYASHGLENFAFDLLLGKPCLIVAHHDFFQDDYGALVELVEKITSLGCNVRWRPLGDVLRRACRRRDAGAGAEEIEMYGNALQVANPSNQRIEARIRKRLDEGGLVPEVLLEEKPLAWATEAGYISFQGPVPARSEKLFRFIYRERAQTRPAGRSLRFKIAVSARRVLSEFRDDYLSKAPFLMAPASKLKKMLS